MKTITAKSQILFGVKEFVHPVYWNHSPHVVTVCISHIAECVLQLIMHFTETYMKRSHLHIGVRFIKEF